MSIALEAKNRQCVKSELIESAVVLLSQQVWCWGCDILRPEGNWLLEVGFDRVEPPADRKTSPSIYTLNLPRGRCLMLRGFGVFFGDRQRGGVFLPRYEFQPQYTPNATLERLPWSATDLPKLSAPSDSQRTACTSLTVDLIDWIRRYEVTLLERLGIEYRRSTLLKWESPGRTIIPAEEMASAWRELSLRIGANFSAYSENQPRKRRLNSCSPHRCRGFFEAACLPNPE